MVVASLVAFWVLPGLILALTPFRYRDIFGPMRGALITAFMAADLFIVLPILISVAIPDVPYYVEKIRSGLPAIHFELLERTSRIDESMKQLTFDAIA